MGTTPQNPGGRVGGDRVGGERAGSDRAAGDRADMDREGIDRPDIEADAIDRMQQAWLRERPSMPVTSMGVVARLARIAKLLNDDHRRLTEQLGVDASTRDLLSTLRRAGEPYELSAGELARRSALTTGAISQRLARAEGQGWIRRIRSAADARTVMVQLTPEGHALIERTVDEIVKREQRLLSGLTGEQTAQLTDLLRILLSDLSERLDVPDSA
ncbi:MarR family winged helix-turn-helix transcriptional regulator [Herbiconiux sp. P17]|uniref:MarR family winged helix-turn-helix transcriptional regulator n=1 Tax=Herbiconiux wuyangfengii TaxID=3342794 RepID=UPI0035BAEDAE